MGAGKRRPHFQNALFKNARFKNALFKNARRPIAVGGRLRFDGSYERKD